MPPLDPVDLLRRMVSFPSLSGEEKDLADFVASYAEEQGVSVNRDDNNVWISVGSGDDCLLFNSHLDVVAPSADHPYDPFTPTLHDGALYGRGSVDAKASGAAMLSAALQLYRENALPSGARLIVALTACEETGGGYNGMEALRPKLPALSAALVGEPTGLAPCLAQKGLLILNVMARGKSAHAARAHLGTNAILEAAADLLRLQSLVLDREDPLLGFPTVTPTVIQGGEARNVVPDRCGFTLDIRSTPAYSHEELINIVSAHLASEVAVHSQRLIPVSTPTESRISRAAVEAAGTVPFGSPTASDWIFLHDVPTVKIGPGDSNLSHTANEHIPVEEVHRAVALYRALALNYFSVHS